MYIWLGSKTTQEEAIHAEQMGRTMFEVSHSYVASSEFARFHLEVIQC